MRKDEVVAGRIVRSVTKGTTAKIVSVIRKDDGSTKVVLDFGWDAPRSRFWNTTVTHTAKYYSLT